MPEPRVTFEIAFVLVVTVVALLLLALGRLSPDLVAFGVLLVLFFAGVITLEQSLSGFSNQAVIAVGAILVISAGLTSTGVAAHLGAWIRRAAGNSEVRLIALTMASVAVLSAFMNSVGACAVLLPAVVAAAREMNTPVSRVLMPLAYGSLLGAMLTLVGTPSNILASGVLEQSGYEPFGLFEFAPFGALALLLGIGLILLTRRRLLPVRGGGAQAATPGVEHQAYRLDERLFEAVVPADSQLAGQSLMAAGIGEAFGIAVLAIEREGNITVAPAPGEVLLAGDYLLLGAREADIDRLRQVHALQVQDRVRLGADALRAGSLSMTELVLRPRSGLVGQTLEDIDFRDRFGSTVLGIWRDGAPRRTRLAKLALEGGDALLVHGPPVALRQLRDTPDFVVLTEDAETAPRARRAPVAVAILLLFVLGLMLNVAPVAIMGVAAAAVMVLTGCVTMDDARSAVEWRAILLIAAMLPLAEAMQTTGTAAFLAERSTESLGTFGALPVLAGVLLLTFFFTHVMGNHVTAVLMAPLAIDAAVRMGADPRMFALGVALAATSGFATPYAHPGNLLVMGPANYRFGDFVRMGLPLGLVTLAGSFILLSLIFGV
ncbi:MAG: SLC13 family permease [Chloroflexi bacterium]|nr:SLC13 family permease [Chloroflexota bacterium]